MAKKPKPISFEQSTKVRNEEIDKVVPLTKKGYDKVADQIHSQYRRFERSDSNSPTALRSLQAIVSAGTKKVSREVEKEVRSSMNTISRAVADDQARWVAELSGKKINDYKPFSVKVADIVASGKLYKGNLALSRRIWREGENLEKTVSWIIAGGLKKGWSVYEIAMSVESYVRPEAQKQWNLTTKDGLRIWPGEIDKNAARLVRTTLQHAYQEAIREELEQNPFVDKVMWLASGPRPCPLCQDRDGRIYTLDDLPLDHPNGMCTFVPIMEKDWPKRLGEWQAGGKDKEIDEFMEHYGIDLEEL